MKIDGNKVRIWLFIIGVGLVAMFGLFCLVMQFVVLFKYGGLPISEVPSFALFFMRGGK